MDGFDVRKKFKFFFYSEIKLFTKEALITMMSMVEELLEFKFYYFKRKRVQSEICLLLKLRNSIIKMGSFISYYKNCHPFEIQCLFKKKPLQRFMSYINDIYSMWSNSLKI